jgi:oxygen-dependent protoporphyrinogen oxidase
MPRIVVVGAGISGLAIAYRLEQALPAALVVVLEERSRTGGTIDTIRRDGFVVEAGPNGFPDNNPATLDLARSIGLDDRLVAASESAGKNRYLLLGGRLRLLPNSFRSFLTTDLLGLTAKARLLMEGFRPRRKQLGDESIYSFARRRAGREIADTFVDAFITGILAGDPKLLSIQAAFPRLPAWERDFGSVQAGMKHAARERRRHAVDRNSLRSMWSFQGGLKTLVESLTTCLQQPPITGIGVCRVRHANGYWNVETEGRDHWNADAVVLACPAYRQAELLADLDKDLSERIAGIPYNRVAVAALGFRREQVPHGLDGFGYLSGQRMRRDVLGVQFCSSIFPGRAPEGMVLVRALCGGWNRREIVDWPNDQLLRAVRDELAQTVGVRTPPVFHQIVRWDRAIPQYMLGHLERIAWIEKRLSMHPGLFAGGNAYRGVAINDCVEQAGKLAERVVAWFRRTASGDAMRAVSRPPR